MEDKEVKRSITKARYSRGKETRERILNVAVRLFGSRGFDSVSTREIADAAAVPPASLRYYFENKQGLYIACLGHIQTSTLQVIEPALQSAEMLLKDLNTNTALLIDAFCDVQAALIDYMIGRPDADTTALFMLRHDLPGDGGTSTFKGDGTIAYRMMACFVQMMMAISGNTLEPQTALIVAGLINGQPTAIQLRRHRLAEMGWDITPERLAWLKQTIRTNTTAILHAHSIIHQSTASSGTSI